MRYRNSLVDSVNVIKVGAPVLSEGEAWPEPIHNLLLFSASVKHKFPNLFGFPAVLAPFFGRDNLTGFFSSTTFIFTSFVFARLSFSLWRRCEKMKNHFD